MKTLYDTTAFEASKLITKKYSTSFSRAVGILSPKIRGAIYSIYGFVRLADEIVDTFHENDKEKLLQSFEQDYYNAYKDNLSLNIILHSFQLTVKKYKIDDELIQAFLNSMKLDLRKKEYDTHEDYAQYIYGSAEAVGLMCLKVFVDGNAQKYAELKQSAIHLGAAFQKVNFLRDLKNDFEILNRSYFPGVAVNELSTEKKEAIIEEIENDFQIALKGIRKLPPESKFGVYLAYIYFKTLLIKLTRTEASEILEKRIRISNPRKISLLIQSYFRFKLNWL